MKMTERKSGDTPSTQSTSSKNVAGIPHNKAKKGLIHYYNDVWMHLTKGYIVSFLCHDQKSIDRRKKQFASRFRRIIALPSEMLIPINGSIHMSISCVLPQEMEMEPDSSFPFTITEEEVKINKLDFYFKPKPHLSKLNYTGLYDLKYVVKIKDSHGIRVEKESWSIPLDYEWQGTASSSGQDTVVARGDFKNVNFGLHTSISQFEEESPERETQDDEKSNEDIVEKPNQDETVPSEVGVSHPLQQDESADSDKKVPVEKSDGTTDVSRDFKQDDPECASIHDIMENAVKKDWLQKAVASATIGHEGGKIELHDFEVIVPSGDISKEMKFKMSIDNNPKNYPENEDPLTPILQVDPHVNFARSVTVRMRTYVSAAAGELYASILYRQDLTDSSWTHFKDVVISDQNEVEFTVRHFTGFIAACKEKLGISRPVFHRFTDVYVQKGTGTILVMYLTDKKTARKLQRDVQSQDYQRVIPLLRRVSSTIASQIPVQIECKKPSGVTYCQELLEGRYLTLHAENFPENYEGSFVGVLSMELGEKKVEEKLSANLQSLRAKTQTPSPARSSQTHVENLAISTFVEHQGDKNCDKRETSIAQKMATKHGQLSSEESDANNTQNIGKDLS